MFKTVIFLTFFFVSDIWAQNCKSLYGQFKYDGNCLKVSDCTGAALVGNCTDSKQICCISDTKAIRKENSLISKKEFLNIFGNNSRNEELYYHIADSFSSAKIDDKFKVAAYLSQVAGETDYFTQLESKNPQNDNDASIGNNKNGDGSLFRGRGGIHLKGRLNYELAANGLKNLGFSLVENPEKAAFPFVAFKIAAWFWLSNAYITKSNETSVKGSLNQLADGTYHSFSLLVNSLTSDPSELLKRLGINDNILKELRGRPLKKGRGVNCVLNSQLGYTVPICFSNQKSEYCGCEGEFEKEKLCEYGFFDDNKKCKNPKFIRCCVETFSNGIDLAILMDNSGSITSPNFEIEKNFVKSLVEKLTIGLSDTRIGIIEFSDKGSVLMKFSETTNSSNLLKKIKGISYTGGGTNTADALLLANKTILQEVNGMRSISEGVPKVVLVITDGASNNRNQTLEAAKIIKNRGFNIITAGVGNVNQDECEQMSSTPSDFEYVNSFDALNDILINIASKSVVQSAPVLTLVPVSTKLGKNQYKYFKYKLDKLKKFSIELDEILGKVALFFSFIDDKPKDKTDVIQLSNPSSRVIRKVREVSSTKKAYLIEVPANENYENLFISVKGYESSNKFEMNVLNKVSDIVNNSSKILSASLISILIIQVFSFLFF